MHGARNVGGLLTTLGRDAGPVRKPSPLRFTGLFCARAPGARLGDRIQQIHCSPLDPACLLAPGQPLLLPEAF